LLGINLKIMTLTFAQHSAGVRRCRNTI